MLIRLGNDEKLVKTVRIDEPEEALEAPAEAGDESGVASSGDAAPDEGAQEAGGEQDPE